MRHLQYKICAQFVLQVMNAAEAWNEANESWIAGLGTHTM